jgi:hypothetical protein
VVGEPVAEVVLGLRVDAPDDLLAGVLIRLVQALNEPPDVREAPSRVTDELGRFGERMRRTVGSTSGRPCRLVLEQR